VAKKLERSKSLVILQVGGFDVPLATALCKNLPAENAQRQLSRPQPTRVVVPMEEEEELGGKYCNLL
jgi:hypothetical protein